MLMKKTALVLAFLALAGTADAQETLRTEKVTVQVSPFATGLANPWGLVFLPDGSMLVTQRNGTLHLVTPEGSVSDPISGVPEVAAVGQGGLLGLALHPKFPENRLLYMSFSEPGPDGTNSTAVARGRLSEDRKSLTDVDVIFSQRPKVKSGLHFGSRLVFDRAGNLFVTLGERGRDDIRVQAQETDNHIGKVVRITDDGGIPSDNPYVNTEGALPEIWSIGHRNIQGATLNPDTGELWTIEHGPMGGDELNIPKPGKNYGWPVISYGVNYDGSPVGSGKSHMEGMEQPVYQWTPVIAPGNMTFYTGDMFPEWKGDLLVAGLREKALVRLEIDGTKVTHEERMLQGVGQRIRDVVQGPDGALYLLTDERRGAILRVSRASADSG
jgi:glucose/arabinose dehydrogenase